MNNIWFTSDHHFGHGNIVEFAERPTTRVLHTEFLTEKWNEVVEEGDTVFHLGDFTLGNRESAERYFNGLNGNVHILGNHFHHDSRWLPKEFGPSFIGTQAVRTVDILPPVVVIHPKIQIDGVWVPHIVLCHYPFRRWDRSHFGSWHLFGHTHQSDNPPIPDNFSLNVGIDAWDYYPVSLEAVAAAMFTRGWYVGWREYD